MDRRAGWLAVASLMLLCPVALAQADDQARLLARRAAEADAFRKLAEIVYGLRIDDHRLVGDLADDAQEIRAELDQTIRGVRFGEPSFQADGGCEIPAELSVTQVITSLRNALERSAATPEDRGAPDELERRLKRHVIRVVGRGVGPANLPRGPDGKPRSSGAPGDPPENWRRISPEGRFGAIEAARRDAQRRLAERLMGLRVSAESTVRFRTLEDSRLATELHAEMRGARETSVLLRPDALIAEVTLRIPGDEVAASLRHMTSLTPAEAEHAARAAAGWEFVATGQGVPNPRFLREYIETAAPETPAWALGSLEAHGVGADDALATPQGKLRAMRAAEASARRALMEKISALRGRRGTIDELQARHENLTPRLERLVADAAVETALSDDGASARITIPGMAVWGVLKDEAIAD